MGQKYLGPLLVNTALLISENVEKLKAIFFSPIKLQLIHFPKKSCSE
jgi:hypothetical protein